MNFVNLKRIHKIHNLPTLIVKRETKMYDLKRIDKIHLSFSQKEIDKIHNPYFHDQTIFETKLKEC
jgi:hypothetical protein